MLKLGKICQFFETSGFESKILHSSQNFTPKSNMDSNCQNTETIRITCEHFLFSPHRFLEANGENHTLNMQATHRTILKLCSTSKSINPKRSQFKLDLNISKLSGAYRNQFRPSIIVRCENSFAPKTLIRRQICLIEIRTIPTQFEINC